MARKSASDAALLELREFGLKYPGAHTKSPWPGHLDLAVNDKTFAYMSLEGQPLSVGCKLPHSSEMALMLPYAKPMAYGLGKSGWVSASPPAGTPIDIEMFKQWLDESYRAQAPKKLVKQLDGGTTKPRAKATGSKTTQPRAKATGSKTTQPRAKATGSKKKR